jgi:undecaprenyl-diphosphatase
MVPASQPGLQPARDPRRILRDQQARRRGFLVRADRVLPVVYGETALYPALRMAAVGLIGLGLYKYLKSRLVRERPYISLAGIVPGTHALDRYSFPSGHTLHAVSFTTLAVRSFPELAWLLVPFAALVAASRVVLGLHYPTDVAAGALIGATLAVLSMVLFPLAA